MKNPENRKSLVDLLYPSPEKREQVKARRFALERLPQDYIENLEVAQVASFICQTNQFRTVQILTELNTDEEIINYRLDAIDDFLADPRLMPVLYKIIRDMLDNDRSNMRKFTEPDSFDEFQTQLDGFLCYINCVESMHDFYEKKHDNIKSAALTGLFKHFEAIYSSGDFIQVKEIVYSLKEAIKSKIKSVTVAINFDERMVPISAGIVGYSDTEYIEKPSVFEKLLYMNAKRNDNQVQGSLFRKYMSNRSDDGDKAINEIDRKLFKGLEKITDDFKERLAQALKSYRLVSFDDLAGLEEQLDFYDGAIKLIQLAEHKGLKMCRPKLLPMERREAEIKGVFDLCLFKSAILRNRNAVGEELLVTNDVSMNDSERFFILTGANNGGKTTFIRAVGLCQLLAQAGLYVPAESCTISPVDFIYTHFPKEEQTGINTSRFTMEIKEFKTISDTITQNSLLIMNESIQSTTPKECVDIASELVKIFTFIGARGFFATHLTDLAYMCDEFNGEPGVKSRTASLVMHTDEATQKRMYKAEHGLPSENSYAKTIFKQFGIDIQKIKNS